MKNGSIKIAVCISGQLRTYKDCAASIKAVFDKYDTHYFVDSWIQVGLSDECIEFGRGNIYQDKMYESLYSIYDPVYINLDWFNTEYFEKLGNIVVPESLKKVAPGEYRSALPMYSKIFSCNEARRKYQERKGIDYDLVVRIRPDIFVHSPPRNLVAYLDGKCYLGHFDKVYYSDQFAIGTPDIMDVYCSVFSRLQDYWASPIGDGNYENILVGERLMKFHLQSNNLRPKRIKGCFRILRESDLDKLGSFFLVSLLWRFFLCFRSFLSRNYKKMFLHIGEK